MRGQTQESTKPAKLYLEWKSAKKVKKSPEGHAILDKNDKPTYEYDGYFTFYDKDKGEEVKVPLPFRFIPLEVLSCVKGFNDKNKCGIWSNEVKSIKNDVLTVNTFKGGLSVKGLYNNIKGEIDAMGGKFANSVYIGYRIDGKLELCNIQIHGAALSPFIEYGKLHKDLTQKGAMQVKSFKIATVGDNQFAEPIFEELPITPETEQEAIELANTLKVYLDGYFGHEPKKEDTPKESAAPTAESNVAQAIDDSSLPF